MTFDEVIKTLLLTCETFPGFRQIKAACAIRNLQGRFRLAIDPGDSNFPIAQLDAELSKNLGHHFISPSLSTRGPREHSRLAKQFLNENTSEEWPAAWDFKLQFPEEEPGRQQIREGTQEIAGATTERTVTRSPFWRSVQRTYSKHSWLSGRKVTPPWPLTRGAPAVISFYSFKGGVGRTTAMAMTARLLAQVSKEDRKPKIVALVDLDLEAPGLGTFLGASADRGVLDFVFQHSATGRGELYGASALPAFLSATEQQNITVFPAGKMSWGFLEQLARLDYGAGSLSSTERDPMEEALRALLEQIRSTLNPDYILLDARAGLHDLGGLALHALSHVDVLVSRNSQQNIDGLRMALDVLGRRKDETSLRRLLVVQSMAERPTPKDREDAEKDGAGTKLRGPLSADEKHFHHEVFAAFQETLYKSVLPAENEDADDAIHTPLPIYHRPDLLRVSTIRDMDPSIHDGEDFAALCRRIQELSTPLDDASSSAASVNPTAVDDEEGPGTGEEEGGLS